ncbi:MAG: Hsp70 nucleotide exchange factor [Amphiamblys sp. WSBS2006]|nr:MAG: Hsp70 nucleotide exchange factor [Amphiamblys sp. WSBS2006]
MKGERTLLNWALEHSDPNANLGEVARKIKNIDPEIIEAVLGRSDAVTMKELATKAGEKQTPTEIRVACLEELESLAEDLNNSRDIAKLSLWPLLCGLFAGTEDPLVRLHAFSVAAAAIQNDTVTQEGFLKACPLPELNLLLLGEKHGETKKKIFRCLSCLLKSDELFDKFFVSEGIRALVDVFTNFAHETSLMANALFFARFCIEEGRPSSLFSQALRTLPILTVDETAPYYEDWAFLKNCWDRPCD